MSKTTVARLLNLEMKIAAEEEDAEKPSGKKPGAKWVEFLKAQGDKTVKNPDTGRTVKYKSLKGPKGKKLLQKKFEQWTKREKQKAETKERNKAKAKARREKEKAKLTPEHKEKIKTLGNKLLFKDEEGAKHRETIRKRNPKVYQWIMSGLDYANRNGAMPANVYSDFDNAWASLLGHSFANNKDKDVAEASKYLTKTMKPLLESGKTKATGSPQGYHRGPRL